MSDKQPRNSNLSQRPIDISPEARKNLTDNLSNAEYPLTGHSTEKQQQINNAWTIQELLDKVRKNKAKASDNSYAQLDKYRSEPYKHKEEEIDRAWEQHDDAERTAQNKADNITAKQIKEFMQKQIFSRNTVEDSHGFQERF